MALLQDTPGFALLLRDETYQNAKEGQHGLTACENFGNLWVITGRPCGGRGTPTVEEKLEVTLRIVLDRPGIERTRQRPLEKEVAFNILGRVYAQLSDEFGEFCQVELEAATGVNPELIRSMNSFAPRHKRALDALLQHGEAIVDDRDVMEAFAAIHDVVITPIGSRWRVAQHPPLYEYPPGDRRRPPRN